MERISRTVWVIESRNALDAPLNFHYADTKGLELIDLKDLRAVVAFLTSDEGRPELKGIGGLSTASCSPPS
ncbi:helicase HerA-like domain-containing protein [Streptomyces griseofuscus]|uniref:helicase HerA-like domain-containing protein n=1 Tax=Streptomyces griseofuscus TaxID=146922 RepID=UPI0038001994